MNVTIGSYDNDKIEGVPSLIFIMYLGGTELGHGRTYDLNVLCPFYEHKSSKVVCVFSPEEKGEIHSYSSEGHDSSNAYQMVVECCIPFPEIEKYVSRFYGLVRH